MGYSGECNADQYLERYQFSKSTQILTNVHLRTSSGFTFEVDTLILSEKFVLIVEVKNLKGIIRFVQNPPHLRQVLETGEETILNCPYSQIETNKSNLNEWFRQQGIQLKSIGLLVLSNPNTIVKEAPPFFPIVYKKQIPHHLQKLESYETILKPSQIHEISRKILANQASFNPYPLCSYYSIDVKELRRGLLCRYCNNLLNRKNRETWLCTICGKVAEDPYNEGISDWIKLVKNTITNEECKVFLGLKDSNAARYALSKSSLIKKGKSTATFYIPGVKSGNK